MSDMMNLRVQGRQLERQEVCHSQSTRMQFSHWENLKWWFV